MPLDIVVLSPAQSVSPLVWQQAIETEGFALRLETVPLDSSPTRLVGMLGRDAVEMVASFRAASARVRADEVSRGGAAQAGYELRLKPAPGLPSSLAANMAAVAYARASGGMLFDEQEGVTAPLDVVKASLLTVWSVTADPPSPRRSVRTPSDPSSVEVSATIVRGQR